MDLDEMLAVMAAPIYASMRNNVPPPEFDAKRNQMMQMAVREAHMIWELARARARAISS